MEQYIERLVRLPPEELGQHVGHLSDGLYQGTKLFLSVALQALESTRRAYGRLKPEQRRACELFGGEKSYSVIGKQLGVPTKDVEGYLRQTLEDFKQFEQEERASVSG